MPSQLEPSQFITKEASDPSNNLEFNESIKTHTHDGINSQKIDINILKVFTATPTHSAQQGTVVLVDNKTDTRKICAMLNGAWYCVTLT